MAFGPSAVSGGSLGYPMRGLDLAEEKVARLRGEWGWRDPAASSSRAVVVAWAW